MAGTNKKSKNEKKQKKFNIFNLFSIIFIIVFTWYSYETYKFYTKHKAIASKDEKLIYPPDPKILIPTIPGCIIITLLRKFLISKFKIISNKIVRRDKPDRDSRVDKCATQIYKSLNYISLSIIGFVLLKNENYFPKELGGNGDIEPMWVALPSQIT